MSNKYQIQKAYDKLRRAKDKDILSLVGQTDWKIVNDVIMNRAMFVVPSGEIVAAKSSKGTHDRFPEDLILYVSGLPENEEPTDPFYFEQVTYDLLRDLTRLKGWIRLNGGSNAVEERCYAVLTDWNEGRPTNTQLYVLEDLINMAYDNNREYVIIFFGEGGIDSKTFYFNQYMPEDIMRIVKRYYTSGRIYEGLKKKRLKEVYPNKGESKKEFIPPKVVFSRLFIFNNIFKIIIIFLNFLFFIAFMIIIEFLIPFELSTEISNSILVCLE